MNVIVNYEVTPGVTTQIDLSKSRDQFAISAAKKYAEINKKRVTDRMIEAFARDSGAYHKVRYLIEDIKSINFDDVLRVFKSLYPAASEDWKGALKCALIIKSKFKEGNYSNGEYIYRCQTAIKLREVGINKCDSLIDEILTSNQ